MRALGFTLLLGLAATAAMVACGKPEREAKVEESPKPAPTAPIDPASTPTAAECDTALRRMTAVVPDGVVGDELDRSDCMAMPRSVVQCLAAVNSEAEADACVAAYEKSRPRVAGTSPTHVGPPPDEARAGEAACREAVANVRKLVPGMAGNDDEMVRDCAATATADEVKCLTGAKTKEELEACDPPEEPPPQP